MFCGCLSKSDFDGTWIGDYSNSTDTAFQEMLFPERRVLTFEAGNCLAQGSKYDYEFQLSKGSINTFTNELTLEGEEQFKIKSVNSDSLVLSDLSNSRRHVYRKLNDSLKSSKKVELLGRKFSWENEQFSDSIYFKDEAFARRPSRHPDGRVLEKSWERVDHSGFDIILFDTDVPYVIESFSDSTINLYSFHKSKLHHVWTEMK